jgi:spermidine synthase
VNALLWLCFALSGAAALALELLWIRSASLVLGTTAATAGAVVAGYFVGLAAGSFLGRRAVHPAVRRYGLLELTIAGSAVVSYGMFRLLTADGAQRMLGWAGTGGRVAVVAILIVPVTMALGATLPTLCHALAVPGTVGSRGGALYALNTLGGAVGIAVMGFGLPSVIGVGACYAVTAAASAAAGVIALAIGTPRLPVAPAMVTEDPVPRRLWAVAAVTGFIGMSLEILWVVLHAQVLHNSVYSFAAVSLVFLLALAAGAEVSALLLRRADPLKVAAGGLLVSGVATIAGMWIFVGVTRGLQYIGMESSLLEYIVRILGLAALTAGPGTLAAGAVLPALWAAFGDRRSVSRPVGELTCANLIGGAGGAIAAAFVVLPLIGLRAGFLLAAVISLMLAAVLATGNSRLRGLAYAGLLVVVVADPAHAPLTRLNSGETLRAVAEGASGIVTVVDTGDDVQLRLDNSYVLGGSAAERNERRQGLLPLLLHPHPQRVTYIGMATGISASAAIAAGVPETTVIEVVPEVAALARRHFGRWNGELLDRPDVRLVVDDGRRHLAASSATFDVIVSDLFIPWHASAGNLYSLEMYRTVAKRLSPGGLFCQWLPLYQLTREEFEIIARTFLTAFPHVTLWRNDFYPNRPVLGLVGARHPVSMDLEGIGRRLAALPAWSRDSLLGAPRSIGMLYVGDLSAVPELFARAALNRDERPVIEFIAPRLTRMNALGDKDWLRGEALAEYTDALTARLQGRAEPALPATLEMAQARRAGAALFRYAVAATSGDSAQAGSLMQEVSRLVPDVIAGVELEGAGLDLAEVRRNLGRLQSEQERLRQQLQSMEQRLRPASPSGERR